MSFPSQLVTQLSASLRRQFADTRSIRGEIELIAIDKFNETHERTLRSDMKYRFVIDTASLR